MFRIYNMHRCPNLLQFIKEEYPQHFTYTDVGNLSKTLPAKFPKISRLSDLTEFEYLHTIEYLSMAVDPNLPFANDWRNYQALLALCPNLKGMYLIASLKNSERLIPENDDIWKNRIEFLKSRGIKLPIGNLYRVIKQLCIRTKWGFLLTKTPH